LPTSTDFANHFNFELEEWGNETKYNYALDASAKDKYTGAQLNSITANAYLNGKLFLSGESLDGIIASMHTTRTEPSLDLKVLVNKDGYEQSDSLSITMTGNQTSHVSAELEQEFVPENFAYFWRILEDSLQQEGTTATVIISNPDFNVQDTFTIEQGREWDRTVPVNETGITKYSMQIIPHVLEGNIPLYPITKVFDMAPGVIQHNWDRPRSLDQDRKIKGDIRYSDTDEKAIGNPIITIKDNKGKVVEVIQPTTGEYRTKKLYSPDFKGTMSVHLPEDFPNNNDEKYFGHIGIPIVPEKDNFYGPATAPILLEDKIINFEDSVIVHNVDLEQRYWEYPVTKEIIEVNPAVCLREKL